MATNSLVNIKTVVVTGASTGIGKACALYLDRHGWRVFAGVRKQLDADDLLKIASPQLTPIFIDVTQPDSIVTAAETLKQAIGNTGLNGLVNNAGIAVGGPLEFIPINKFKTQFDINVIGQLAVIQALLPLLRTTRGRIINISSISGRVAMPFVGPYSASKFALEALSDSLRTELHPWGIKVISVQPGPISTPIWDKTASSSHEMRATLPPQAEVLYGQAMNKSLKAMIKTGKAGIPAEKVAEIIAHALTAKRPKNRYVVGKSAQTGALLVKILPEQWRDWLIVKLGRKI